MRQLVGNTFQIPGTRHDFLPWPRPKFLKAERGVARSCLKSGCFPKAVHHQDTARDEAWGRASLFCKGPGRKCRAWQAAQPSQLLSSLCWTTKWVWLWAKNIIYKSRWQRAGFGPWAMLYCPWFFRDRRPAEQEPSERSQHLLAH